MAETESVVEQFNEACTQAHDFEKAYGLLKGHRAELAKQLTGAGIRDALKKTTDDRLLLSYLDGAGLEQPGGLDAALVRLEKLIAFTVGALVINSTWGLGKVRRVDYFYKRLTVDFRNRKGHQFTYAAATDMLTLAPEGHILVLRESDPAAFEAMLKERPADFIKAMLRSYGDMTAQRLEDVAVQNGFVKAVNWKAFWDTARAELKRDRLVTLPARKADPIQLREQPEDYGSKWLAGLSSATDPKLILAAVREYVAEYKFETAPEAVKAAIGDRLAFAVTAARRVDDALYARLACQVTALGLAEPKAEEMREFLKERRRYIRAAEAMPAREVGSMIEFLAVDAAAKTRLYAALPDLCSNAVAEVVRQFGGEAECREAVAKLMREPKAPATLVTLLVGRYEQYRDWKELPPLIVLLTHAIALGEGRQSGETLRMQNIVRRLFADSKWLEKMLSWLNADEQALIFERFQASIAWDPSTHHTIVVRMMHLKPELEAHFVKIEKKKEYARLTSFRSFAQHKAEYLKLINEDMPENIRKIEFAKGFGDLSENAEYQYAKDEQRQLMQKQAKMQDELEKVKPSDFADATLDEVMPGVAVLVATAAGEKLYSLLGEWDNDVELGVLSSQSQLGKNLLGKKVGETFKVPGVEAGQEQGTVKEIRALSPEIREWMKLPAGMQI